MKMLRIAIEVAVIVALIGAFFYFSLNSAAAQDNCTTTCQWVGDVWTCHTWCF